MNKELNEALNRGIVGDSVLVRTWFRDVNGNSYQSGVLYHGGEVLEVWGKSYQGVAIDEGAKLWRERGVDFETVTIATRLKDFFKV